MIRSAFGIINSLFKIIGNKNIDDRFQLMMKRIRNYTEQVFIPMILLFCTLIAYVQAGSVEKFVNAPDDPVLLSGPISHSAALINEESKNSESKYDSRRNSEYGDESDELNDWESFEPLAPQNEKIGKNHKNRGIEMEDGDITMIVSLTQKIMKDIKVMKRKISFLEINQERQKATRDVRIEQLQSEIKHFQEKQFLRENDVDELTSRLNYMFLRENKSRKCNIKASNDVPTSMESTKNIDRIGIPSISLSTEDASVMDFKKNSKIHDPKTSEPIGSSTWSRLHISPNELGSMPYGQFSVNIYAHTDNNVLEKSGRNETKRFFYTPMVHLNYGSARSAFNNATKRPELSFRIEMWNDALQERIVNFTSMLVGHPLRTEQISVIPLEKAMLVNRIPSFDFQIVKEWIPYRSQRFLEFAFFCLQIDECKQLEFQMKNDPKQFKHLELQFSMMSQTIERRQINIKIDNIITGKLWTKLTQTFPNSTEFLLKTDDEHRLRFESATNVLVESFDDSSVVSNNAEEMIQRILENLLKTSRVIIKEQNDKMWDSVFWDKENYRPDKSSKTLTDVYNKLDQETKRKFVNAFNQKKKGDLNASVSLPEDIGASVGGSLDLSSSGGNTSEAVDILMRESKSTVEWNGEKFIPKAMELKRINKPKAEDLQNFQSKKATVSYTTAMLTIGVDISFLSDTNASNQEIEGVIEAKIKDIERKLQVTLDAASSNWDEKLNTFSSEFETTVLELRKTSSDTLASITKLQGSNEENKKDISYLKEIIRKPDRFKNEMPRNCRDLYCLGQKANGFFFVHSKEHGRLEAVYCDFSNHQSTSAATLQIGERRIGPVDVKSAVYFYVERGSSQTAKANEAIGLWDIVRLRSDRNLLNTTSGEFMAPVNGVYHFQFSGVKDDKNRALDLFLTVNSIKIGNAHGSYHSDFATASLHATIRLNKSDIVRLILYSGTLYSRLDSPYTHFSGWLMEEFLNFD